MSIEINYSVKGIELSWKFFIFCTFVFILQGYL